MILIFFNWKLNFAPSNAINESGQIKGKFSQSQNLSLQWTQSFDGTSLAIECRVLFPDSLSDIFTPIFEDKKNLNFFAMKIINFFFRIILNIHYEDKLPQRRRRQQKGAYNRQWSNPLEALRYIKSCKYRVVNILDRNRGLGVGTRVGMQELKKTWS